MGWLRLLMFASLLLAPQAVMAAPYAVNYAPADLGLAGVALNTSPKMILRSDGFAQLTIYISLTRVAATAVNISCTSGPTPTVQAPVGVAAVNGTTGVITMSQASWTYPVSASGLLRVIVAPVNDVFFICTFTGTGAGSSDLVSVYARLGGTP